MSHLSLTIKTFNDKIKLMNQTNSKSLMLTALEARNLHNDIFALLTQIAELTHPNIVEESVADFDGGTF